MHNTNIAQAFISKMFSSLDLDVAENLINEYSNADDFVDWIDGYYSELYGNDGPSFILGGDMDIVELAYRFLIEQVDRNDEITDAILEYAEDHLYGNYMCTSIDCDLSDDAEFKKLVRKSFLEKPKKGASIEELLTEYYDENGGCPPIVAWLLSEMNVNIG